MLKLILPTLLGFALFANAARAEFTTRRLPRPDGSEIHYYLDLPASSSYPIVLFLQGSECRSVIGRSGMPKDPSESFGAGFLMIEKYGITAEQSNDDDQQNCTSEFEAGNTFDQRVLDATSVITLLKETLPNWNKELLVIGGSEGGMLAPAIARVLPETKRVAMLVAGNGRTMLEDTREALALTARQAGLSDEQISELLAEYEVKTREIRQNPNAEESYLGHTFRWWNSVLWVNPLPWMLEFNGPQLLIHGTADTSVPVASARLAAEAFQRAGNDALTYWELSGYNHALVDAEGKNRKPEVLQRALQWLLQKD